MSCWKVYWKTKLQYRVGLNGGVYAGSQSNVLFKDDVELPEIWDNDSEIINVDDCYINVLL